MQTDDPQEQSAYDRAMSEEWTLALTPGCPHLFSTINEFTKACMRCGGYASKAWVRAWVKRGAPLDGEAAGDA
jgi:hypothetical protein